MLQKVLWNFWTIRTDIRHAPSFYCIEFSRRERTILMSMLLKLMKTHQISKKFKSQDIKSAKKIPFFCFLMGHNNRQYTLKVRAANYFGFSTISWVQKFSIRMQNLSSLHFKTYLPLLCFLLTHFAFLISRKRPVCSCKV